MIVFKILHIRTTWYKRQKWLVPSRSLYRGSTVYILLVPFALLNATPMCPWHHVPANRSKIKTVWFFSTDTKHENIQHSSQTIIFREISKESSESALKTVFACIHQKIFKGFLIGIVLAQKNNHFLNFSLKFHNRKCIY